MDSQPWSPLEDVPAVKSKAYLFLRFRCGHLMKLSDNRNAHRWLDEARTMLCNDCELMRQRKEVAR